MIRYIECNINGDIVTKGTCSAASFLGKQSHMPNRFIEDRKNACQQTQKVKNGQVVNKTSKELETEKTTKQSHVLPEDEIALITNKQYEDLLIRLETLEISKEK